MKPLRVAVLGATGAVGREMWGLLESSGLPVEEALGYTGSRSAGTILPFRGGSVTCREISTGSLETVDLVLASAGSGPSREWSPRFAAAGAKVIDNSSAFRSDPACPLVVPEVNGDALLPEASIIANPNCSTIQMVAALAPLHEAWTLTGIRVATYQSVSGAGARAMDALASGSRDALDGRVPAVEVFPHAVAFNALPHIGPFDEEGETAEESKMRNETRRILDVPGLPVSAFCVRVPVFRGHSEAVWASFARTPDPAEARSRMARAGVVVEDDPEHCLYPLATRAAGRDEVFAGRVRPDPADPNGLCLWVVADNLRKGAAVNAFRIALLLAERGWLGVGRERS